MLNYGYAVLTALWHRSLLIHGLLPTLGVQHTTRYRSTPLVFDAMEPFRPVVDLLLAQFLKEPFHDMKAWTKYIGTALREHRMEHKRYSLNSWTRSMPAPVPWLALMRKTAPCHFGLPSFDHKEKLLPYGMDHGHV